MDTIVEKNTNKLTKKTLICILLVVFVFAVIMEAGISFFVLHRDIRQSTTLFLNQIENSIEKNKAEEEDKLEELKETYSMSAQMGASILSDKKDVFQDINELKKIAALLKVDELHIFDESGTIVYGTNPEYYGYNFDSGDQMGFFKPMLQDKTLTMCQDVTPNTAEGKSMMYAIAWDNKGDHMIQVGVEPKRLLVMLENHELENVINSIPITEGYEIFAVYPSNNIVIASTNIDLIGTRFDLPVKSTDLQEGSERYFVNYRQVDDSIIVVTYRLKNSINTVLVPLEIISVYLLIAGTLIVLLYSKLKDIENVKNAEIMKQYGILKSMSEIYYTMHLINLVDDTVEEFRSQGTVKEIVNKSTEITAAMVEVMNAVTKEEYLEKALEFTDLTTVAYRMLNKKIITAEFVGKNIGWFIASFIVVERNRNGKPVKVIFTTRSIDEEKKKEENLINQSNTDELTGCYNRRFYEDTITELVNSGLRDDLVYISVDVNGLKIVNDTVGHAAGDELIIGAGRCMEEALGKYGKVFRVGGDEFVAIINVDINNIKDLLKALDTVTNNWRGNLVERLSLSYGYVVRAENPGLSIHEISTLADKKMYEAKSLHYRAKGVDRRGQKDAHIALCSLYTKILKINLSNDSYQIVNMDISEKTEEKGFSSKISEWLRRFGESGQVYPEDLQEYLAKTDVQYIKNHFAEGKKLLRFSYRRKYEDDFRQVIMEIIPANDYNNDNQSYYLYIKNVDLD